MEATNTKLEHTGTKPVCLVVLVLHKMLADESPAYRALARIMAESPEVKEFLRLLVWDNSPQATLAPKSLCGHFYQDTSNPGLAVPYNFALRQASADQLTWLVLLDQDTEVTAAYFSELLSTIQSVTSNVAAVLPRLVHRSRIVSPVLFRALGPSIPYDGDTGVVPVALPLQAFNSCAALRVSAMQSTGGFDLRFPLDYLDHATFAALHRQGYSFYVLRASVQHSLSSDTGGASTAKERTRQASTLNAQSRFVSLYGTFRERCFFPFKLLRTAVSTLVHKRDLPGALQIIRQIAPRWS